MATFSTTGKIPFNVPEAGKLCATWYQTFGNFNSGRRPLVALHGGPGVNSEYLEILSDITALHSIPLIIYDQIGTGRSTHLPEKMGDESFWTVQLFLDELNNVLCHFGVQNDYDLFGHSWGGMLAANHAVSRPPGLKHLILASAPSDIPLMVEYLAHLRSQLPQAIQDVLNDHEQAGTTESEDYRQACNAFYSRHICRLNPMPEPIMAGFACIQKDPTVHSSMSGSEPFTLTGTLKNWSIIKDAQKITAPTLLTNGRYDEITDEVIAPFFKEIADVQWVKFSESAHMPHFEERTKFMRIISNFLTD